MDELLVSVSLDYEKSDDVMKSKKIVTISLSLLFSTLTPSMVLGVTEGGAYDEQAFTLKVGQVYFTSLETTFLADDRTGPLSTSIDFSRDLNMEDSNDAFLVEGYYRHSRKHRFDFTYYELERTGDRAIDREITLGDTTFLVNTNVFSSFKTRTLIATYSYMFHSHDEIDLGLSAGLHVNDVKLKLEAPGASLEASESQLMPLPIFGVLLNYKLSDKLTVNYQTRAFLLNFDDYRGSLRDTKISLEHHTFKNFGFEFGFNRKSGELEVREPQLLTKLNNVATGWMLNLIGYF